MRFTTVAATALCTALSAPLAFAADVMPANGMLVNASGMLVNASGMTVYVFDKDVADSGKSACSGGCLVAWPAVIATEAAPAAPYGSIKREDNGAMQLTYKGKPLYLYKEDKKPGDVAGDNFKNVWHVVKP